MCSASGFPGLFRPGVSGRRVAVSVPACGKLMTFIVLRLGIGAVAWGLGVSGGFGLGARCVVRWVLFLFRRFPIAHMVLLYKFPIFTDLGKQPYVFACV